MASFSNGLLESYNSCHDSHLANYMRNERVDRQLKAACVISDDRRVLTEGSCRMKNDILEKKCFSCAATSGRSRKLQSQFIKTLEKLERVENVARVRQDTGRIRKQTAPPVVIFDPTGVLLDPVQTFSKKPVPSNVDHRHSSLATLPRSHHTSQGHSSAAKRSYYKRRCRSSSPTNKSSRNKQHQSTTVTLYYFGTSMTSDKDGIKVVQQCAGNSSITVYKGHVSPSSYFTFRCRPHVGYPFSLTLYINGDSDSRVSTCCECKHTPRARLSGKHGYFAWVSVQNAVPCYRCQPDRQDRLQHESDYEDSSSNSASTFTDSDSDD